MLLSTANNHTFDRSYEGLVSTIRFLDQKGIPHPDRFAGAKPKKQETLRKYTRQIYETVTRKPIEEPWVQEEYTFWEASNE